MILLRKSVGAFLKNGSHFVAEGRIITSRCKSIKAPVSKKSVKLKPSLSKLEKSKNAPKARISSPIKNNHNITPHQEAKNPVLKKTNLKAGDEVKSSKQSSKDPEIKTKKPKPVFVSAEGRQIKKVKILSFVKQLSTSKLSKDVQTESVDTVNSVAKNLQRGKKPLDKRQSEPPSSNSVKSVSESRPSVSREPTNINNGLKKVPDKSEPTLSGLRSASDAQSGIPLKKTGKALPSEMNQTNATTLSPNELVASVTENRLTETESTISSKQLATNEELTPDDSRIVNPKVDSKLHKSVNWTTFLYDIFGTTSTKKVVQLVHPSRYEQRADEYSYETMKKKKALEMQRNKPNVRGFKFINYDKLIELGVGRFEFDKEEVGRELKVSVNNQHLILVHNSLIPAITIKQPECLTFRNPTGLVALEQIGRSLFFEYFVKWSLMSGFNPHQTWAKFSNECKGLQFVQLDESATILFQGLQPLNVFVAMVYLEDKDYDYAIMKFLNPLVKPQKISTGFTTQLLIDKYIPYVNAYLQAFPAPIDFNIFSQVFRPQLLHSLPIKLPAMPKLHNRELYKFAEVSLLSSRMSAFAQYPKLVLLRERLDSMGDAVLKRYSVEFMVHYSKTNLKFRWNMSDVDFINTNIVFSRLSFAYKLYRALNGHKNQESMNQIITSSNLDVANELLGDMFERMVAIEYLDDPEVCRTWIFKIYEVMLANLTKEKDSIEFFDKEKFIELYQHQLKTKTMY
ncbi:hypothetical protein KGF57_000122 [Candida theae]|uniref:RNase III domain-containing protein n=1 Tax=Candida theae TaxID=1198502 RepID=A0AAD5BKB1_9ASCO|nr:uncharacterized protein KGF57_000122 [Candida theae]KAI5968428.1 hypothetical protein KGF57_000122 [Candida theae]